jgi:tetratricopeptide (TPR) repeat protein
VRRPLRPALTTRSALAALTALLTTPPVMAATFDFLPLWDFDQPEVSEQRFRAALPNVEGDDRLVLQTQIARTFGLRSRFDEAHALLDRIEPLLAQAGPRPKVLYALERGRTFRSSGAPERASTHFESALTQAEAAGEEALALDAIHMLALVSTGEAALDWNRRGIAAARAATDPRAQRWAVSMLNNLGYALREQGRLPEALAAFEDNLREAQRQKMPARSRLAQWQIARTLRAMKRDDEALAIQRQLEASQDPPDGYVLEEIAELLEALGRSSEARPYFARAYTALSALAELDRPPPERLARLKARGGQ